MTSTRLAGGIIIDDKKRIFLMHRTSQGKNQWETPGGKVELGEADEAAARRELKEELGIEVNLGKKIGEGDFTEDKANNYHYVWFEVIDPDVKQMKLEPRYTESGFFSQNDMKDLQLSAGTKRFLELYPSVIA